ncbi:MAG: hypothetical protein CL840_21755 [Crocinitomicaceae bacterium]|nr:hypothetical protein [Crocinitomicaceae bacterium]|tara:strand:+ start:11786 stop:12817 length:1032 start_codon:yes stop_codon:yes gene_type:complete
MKNVLLVIFVLIGSSVLGQNLQKILDQYKDSLSNYGIVALVDNGKSIQTAQIGWASEESPMQIDHRFCIGSVTKLYTATIILKLNELKLLSIDDSIAKFIPPHRFIDGSITIRQLLNHTSGIKDIVDAKLSNASLLDPYFDYSESYILNLIDTIDFAKGTKHSYSNSNYFLLRKIIERVTDKPYESVLDELIIKPLNLTNTFPYHSNNIDSLAHPILGKQDFHDLPKIGVNQISIGIGNVVSTAADVNAFIRSLFMDNRILNSNSLKTMTTFKTFNESTVGLGVFLENFGGRTVQGHSGRTISYIAYAFVDKPKRISFVLICNNANDPYIDKLIEKVCDKGKW